MSTIKFTFKNGSIEFGTMKIPTKKRIALVKFRGAQPEILGYFVNDDAADEFNKMLETIVDEYNKSFGE